MDSLQNAYSQHALILWIALAIVVSLLVFWLLMLQRRGAALQSRLDDVFGDLQGHNTAQQLVEYLSTVRRTAASVQRVEQEHREIADVFPSVIRHVGLVRFSPFHDTGGDQSFTLALLNGQGDGVVVTALHSRSDSRLYAKPVEGGQSHYSLTPEEREAMEKALGRHGGHIA